MAGAPCGKGPGGASASLSTPVCLAPGERHTAALKLEGVSPLSVRCKVVNVPIKVLMSYKWNPTSKCVRVMSSHLTNGDLIDSLMGCLSPNSL